LEAFGLGCPVIATNVAGAEEQIGEAGLLVNTLDANGLVEALLRIAKDHDFRKELIARGRQRASRSSTDNFLRGVFKALDEFEPFRRTWGNGQGDA
jgi:glycosyltransferase involved in cell wall biosynthesis